VSPEGRDSWLNIKKPIFIVGSGRSGTTLLYNLLAIHPEVCWFSNLSDRFPRFRLLAALHRILQAPLIGSHMRGQIVGRTMPSLRPMEAESIYHRYCGFEHARKTTAGDLTEGMEKRFKKVIRAHLRFTGKKRFLSKQTSNTQRIELIHTMFPDAYYVHIIRNGRAVANSLLNVRWWNNVDIWWLGYKPPKWEELGREPIELCALHWKRDVEEILHNRHLFGNRYIEVRYEELVEKPVDVIHEVVRSCELREIEDFRRWLPRSLTSKNYKWESQLSERQKLILDRTIGDFMVEVGYDS